MIDVPHDPCIGLVTDVHVPTRDGSYVAIGIRNGREVTWRNADDRPLPETDLERWHLAAADGSTSPEAGPPRPT